MKNRILQRYSLMLDVLSEICDIERQLVWQGEYPFDFVPERLLERWYALYAGGRGIYNSGMSEELAACFIDFDYHLNQVVDAVPENSDDKEDYILNDEVWQVVRDMADWTLTRAALAQSPYEAEFSVN